MKKYIFLFTFSFFVLILSAIYQLIQFSDNGLHIIFCNVGQGDSIFIRSPKGIDIIVDGGPSSKVLECLSNYMPFWDRTIELVFLTHPDADHLTGLIDVFKNYNIKYFGTSNAPKDTEVFKQLNEMIAKEGIKKNYLYRGDTITLSDGVKIRNYWPTHEFITTGEEDTNYYSLVQNISYGKFHMLLTGDIPFQILNSIMPITPDIDVFKPPHHGSKTGIDEYTFQHKVPRAAVISSGKGNKYGHPNPEVLKILEEKNIPYYRTDKLGNIEIIIDEKGWSIK